MRFMNINSELGLRGLERTVLVLSSWTESTGGRDLGNILGRFILRGFQFQRGSALSLMWQGISNT